MHPHIRFHLWHHCIFVPVIQCHTRWTSVRVSTERIKEKYQEIYLCIISWSTDYLHVLSTPCFYCIDQKEIIHLFRSHLLVKFKEFNDCLGPWCGKREEFTDRLVSQLFVKKFHVLSYSYRKLTNFYPENSGKSIPNNNVNIHLGVVHRLITLKAMWLVHSPLSPLVLS